jgi:hypothetical protein
VEGVTEDNYIKQAEQYAGDSLSSASDKRGIAVLKREERRRSNKKG